MRSLGRTGVVVLAVWIGGVACSINADGTGPLRPGRGDAGAGMDGAPGTTDAPPAGCEPPGCEDGIPCTLDTCAGGTTCTHLPDHGLCVAAAGGLCDPALGCQYPACDGCDDGDPCTDDTCDALGSCMHPFNTAACDDDLECTTGDVCSDGACSGVPRLCDDDGNSCTSEACEEGSGCTTTVRTDESCDDGDYCTIDDVCDGRGDCTGDPRDCGAGCHCDPDDARCETNGLDREC